MTDAYAAKIREAVDKLNKTASDKINSAEYQKIVQQLDKDWWAFRKNYGSMNNDDAALEKLGFPASKTRPGIIDAFKNFLAVFEKVLQQRSSNTSDMPVIKAFVPYMRHLVPSLDYSTPLCVEIENKKVVVPLLKCLDSADFLSVREKENLDEGYGLHVLNTMIVFANVMYRRPDVADVIKEQNGAEILSKYSSSRAKVLALRALVAQSYLVSDPKGKELPVSEDMLKFIWEGVNQKLQRSFSGPGDFTLYGLLVYLHQIIRCSDSCGQGLLRYGFLDSLVAIMTAPAGKDQGQSTPKEKYMCAKICWSLALLESCGTQIVKTMKQHAKLTSALEGIKSLDADANEAAEGALWQIKVKSLRSRTARLRVAADAGAQAASASTAKPKKTDSRSDKGQPQASTRAAAVSSSSASHSSVVKNSTQKSTDKTPTAAKSTSSSTAPTGETSSQTVTSGNDAVKRQVMISYTSHWKPQFVLRMNEELKKMGVKTWIYNSDMKGDMYDQMATAIETSAAVLVCYSNAYFNSEPCHAELNYAREWKRILVPVRLEQFNPRGWLGISISGKLFYDFAAADQDETLFKSQLSKVVDFLNSEFDKLGL